MTGREKVGAFFKFVDNQLTGKPRSVTLELTRRCNAKCDYCSHWTEPKREEIDDFVAVVRHFDPLTVTICGGEPFLRPDCLDIVRAVKSLPGYRYVAIITNGWFLNEVRARALYKTGIDQISISLNFPDTRHDDDRKLPGLFGRIAHIVPKLTGWGANVCLNAIIMNDNLDDVVPLAHLAKGWGASIGYTLYSELPGENTHHLFPPDRMDRLREVIAELKRLRRTLGNVTNSDFYFDKALEHASGQRIGGCPAGRTMLHVTPQGMVRPCAELPAVSHYKDYDWRKQPPVDCTACWQACRGEWQAPITLDRVVEYGTKVLVG